MNEFEKILEMAEDERIKLAEGFKGLLHTELMFGQSMYLCRYGTLSDGHEKFTDAQKYYQAIREMWILGQPLMAGKRGDNS